jgi:hypothetical protein
VAPRRLSFTGRSFAWLATLEPDGGHASVSIDGRAVASRRLEAEEIVPAWAVSVASWPSAKRHKVTIRVVTGRVTVRELIVLE